MNGSTKDDRKKFNSIEEMLFYINYLDEKDKYSEMCRSTISYEIQELDPFSDKYRDECLTVYRTIAGRDYEPRLGELLPANCHIEGSGPPPPFHFGDSKSLGEYFCAWGGIMRVLDLKRGMSILELGAGDGHLSIALARMGGDVSILDIESRYLDRIASQAKLLDAEVSTRCGLFLDGYNDKKFDRILFFESFHHEIYHNKLLVNLHQMLNPGGFIVFSGEPIVEIGDPCVPYCWGPRLDALSITCMRDMGWMEIGFQRGYFVELLMRHGFNVTRWMNPITAIGNCFIAKPNGGIVKPGEIEMDVARGESGWHAGEQTHRWTRDHAILPLDRSKPWRSLILRGDNHLPEGKLVSLRLGDHQLTRQVESGESFEISIALDDKVDQLEIITKLTIALDLGGIDPRPLGISVREIEYQL